MKLSELLVVSEKPLGWSNPSYYRVKSVAARILKCNNPEIEVTEVNLDYVLKSLNINVNYKNGRPKVDNRTYKTYITEIRRYILHNLKKSNYGCKESKRA